jgi:ferric-dicitrate binding protein FerR (iron transport regulator)
LWLASVVETDEDRRVCFENVLELNPDNMTAKAQLNKLEQKALLLTMNPQLLHREEERANRRRRTVRTALLLLILLTAVAAVSVWVFF